MRKIAIVTGTRAEYGLLFWIIKNVQEDPELELQLIVTGMHLMPEFGSTVTEIEKDGFPIAEKVDMGRSGDSEEDIACSMGNAIIGFSHAYKRLRPDILLVLGDRYEILAAVAAAAPFRIPVAHIHGGESTEGAMDELFRHAITKMSHLHFTANEKYAERVRKMGEDRERVFCFGSPALDNITRINFLSRNELSRDLRLPSDKSWGIVTCHPVTLEKGKNGVQIDEMLSALRRVPEVHWIITFPNADTDSQVIIDKIKECVEKDSSGFSLFISLGRVRYLSLLKNAVVMVGNSSSGMVEAPSFKLPVVNIGDRQKGRLKAQNVLDVSSGGKDSIEAFIRKAISNDFRKSLEGCKNPYGDGHASEKIVHTIKSTGLSGLLKKSFNDSNCAGGEGFYGKK